MDLKEIVRKVLSEKKKKSKLCRKEVEIILLLEKERVRNHLLIYHGRAVKVCKGSIKGAGGKRKKSYKESIDYDDALNIKRDVSCQI